LKIKKEKIEKFVNKAIPYVLIFLAVLIILENPFWTLVHLENYEPYVTILDFIIIGFFVVELYFKWIRTKNLKKFVKLYWIEILAVFPIYLISRVFILTSEILRTGEEVQKVLHEAILFREARLIEEGMILTRAERVVREAKPLLRGFRSGTRLLRLLIWRFKVAHFHLIKHSLK